MSIDQNFDDLPETFVHRNDDGTIEQVRDPCYNLLAPGFYGIGQDATFYDEGEIIRMGGAPNFHMQPLNKAAGQNMRTWLESLPIKDSMINIEDMVEASQMLASNPQLGTMNHEQVAQAAMKLAMALKAKRDSVNGMVVPPMSGQTIYTANANKSKAPPMLATRYVDPALRGPGHTGERAVIHEPKPQAPTVRRAKAAIGGVPIRDGQRA